VLSPDKEARAREALEQKMAELYQGGKAPNAPAAPSVASPPTTPAQALVPEPLPPLTKEGLERLAELNALYIAGRITPAVYHQERAKIVQSLGKP
jgi:hypothetical protein